MRPRIAVRDPPNIAGNVKRRRTQYRKCGSKYRLVWYARYTTPERKLTGESSLYAFIRGQLKVGGWTEALVHDELTAKGARAHSIKCSCLHRHREWYCWNAVGGFNGVEGAFLRWMGRRGHTTTNVTYY